jgi:alpha-mannosidase
MATELTIHMIGNAHLDPVWLWPWQRGADEALATCRSACDILDAYADARFTRGEAWVYDWVRRMDPVLFARIRAHIAAGRWEVVNGYRLLFGLRGLEARHPRR